MGYKEVQINLPVELFEKEMNERILKKAGVKTGRVSFLRKSLDSRKKDRIVWNTLAGVLSDELPDGTPPPPPRSAMESLLDENYRKGRNKRVVIVGSGPAGLFAGLTLLRLGYAVTLLERGAAVEDRARLIQSFEEGGAFSPVGNYLFGEGGAGTFSDGKLTSRTKKIVRERDWIHSLYVSMGGPEEILWSTHPHLGSDRLYTIAQNMRLLFREWGGEIEFETLMTDLKVREGRIVSLDTNRGEREGDFFLLAPGHSARETYRMLLDRGVPFRGKNFAIGFRMEHRQEEINLTQWGRTSLPGVKAAEYRLTHKTVGNIPVYTFCMCPGGQVVPSTPYEDNNLVNGMSSYARNGLYANAALVAGIQPQEIDRSGSPRTVLDWLEGLESRFKSIVDGYEAPASTIEAFLAGKTGILSQTSYPLGLKEWDLAKELPPAQIEALKEGLGAFVRKMPRFGEGQLLGLESKTSAPLQVLRDESGRPEGWDNLWICGEGSGWSGGIISSAADGIKGALSLLKLDSAT
ncbi:MAG: FAD-dependent monooxygenase [Spirochaetales bacterium]|nr:FAD-dependent monooxygenase [Spirochaetales bacterium]